MEKRRAHVDENESGMPQSKTRGREGAGRGWLMHNEPIQAAATKGPALTADHLSMMYPCIPASMSGGPRRSISVPTTVPRLYSSSQKFTMNKDALA